LFQQLVTPGDDRAERLGIVHAGWLRCLVLDDGPVERVINSVVSLEQALQLTAQRLLARTLSVEKRLPGFSGQFRGGSE
jgi:hypothetical protein